jgi:hypothetical protein
VGIYYYRAEIKKLPEDGETSQELYMEILKRHRF